MTMTLKQQREARIAEKAAAKAAKEAAEQARIRSNPIFAAIAPQRAEAIAQAQKYTAERLARFVTRFPVGGNFKELAPRPDSFRTSRKQYQSMMAFQYQSMMAFRSLASRVIRVERGRWPEYTETVLGVNEEGVEQLIAESGEEAALSFDAYVAKLTDKVGPCDSASVTGTLWQRSLLTVRKGETTERWQTQQIINFSVYGKAYNQWPTRKVK